MGGEASQEYNEEASKFLSNYKMVSKIQDERLGELILLKHNKTGEYLA